MIWLSQFHQPVHKTVNIKFDVVRLHVIQPHIYASGTVIYKRPKQLSVTLLVRYVYDVALILSHLIKPTSLPK